MNLQRFDLIQSLLTCAAGPRTNIHLYFKELDIGTPLRPLAEERDTSEKRIFPREVSSCAPYPYPAPILLPLQPVLLTTLWQVRRAMRSVA